MNQPGGAGAVAIKAVAPAAPDGHTLYMSLASNFIALPELQKNFPVDVLRDFVPIGFVGEHPLVIAAAPTLGVSTLVGVDRAAQEQARRAQRRGRQPRQHHPSGRRVAAQRHRHAVHAGALCRRRRRRCPTCSAAGCRPTIDAIPSMRGPIDSGQVKPLGGHVASGGSTISRRLPAAAETIPGFEAMGWMALMAPPGTPQAIARKISDDLRTVQAQPELQTACRGARQLHPPDHDHAGGAHRLHP